MFDRQGRAGAVAVAVAIADDRQAGKMGGGGRKMEGRGERAILVSLDPC